MVLSVPNIFNLKITWFGVILIVSRDFYVNPVLLQRAQSPKFGIRRRRVECQLNFLIIFCHSNSSGILKGHWIISNPSLVAQYPIRELAQMDLLSPASKFPNHKSFFGAEKLWTLIIKLQSQIQKILPSFKRKNLNCRLL